MNKPTTADLRIQAWDAKELGDFERAAALYQEAYDNYPSDVEESKSVIDDRKLLRHMARSCRAMFVSAEGMCK